jgi:hypothetical protein
MPSGRSTPGWTSGRPGVDLPQGKCTFLFLHVYFPPFIHGKVRVGGVGWYGVGLAGVGEGEEWGDRQMDKV